MKIFGYSKKQVHESGLLELNEVTFQGNPSEVKQIAMFLLEMAEAIESNPGKIDHFHISSRFSEWPNCNPEIIVAEE